MSGLGAPWVLFLNRHKHGLNCMKLDMGLTYKGVSVWYEIWLTGMLIRKLQEEWFWTDINLVLPMVNKNIKFNVVWCERWDGVKYRIATSWVMLWIGMIHELELKKNIGFKLDRKMDWICCAMSWCSRTNINHGQRTDGNIDL